MRKLFTTLVIVLGFYGLASAQAQKGNVEFGVNVGLNNSYVQDSNSEQHTDGVAGLNVGVSADDYFSDRWSLKVKVIYDQKGWGNGFVTDDSGNEIDGVNIKLNYITVPVMANWHFGHTRNWYLDFGPYVGFLTSANAAGYDVKSAFSSTDGGVCLGLGVKIPISDRAKFFVEYEGQGGVANVFNNSSDGSNFQNVRGSLNIGVNF
jgi:hypothetical protein